MAETAKADERARDLRDAAKAQKIHGASRVDVLHEKENALESLAADARRTRQERALGQLQGLQGPSEDGLVAAKVQRQHAIDRAATRAGEVESTLFAIRSAAQEKRALRFERAEAMPLGFVAKPTQQDYV